jgi:voltage-gated potassium channel
LLTLLGTVGFHSIAGKSWIDSLYLAVNTLTTLGSETLATDDSGKIFVICYVIACLGIFTYSAFSLGQWIVSAEVGAFWEKRRMHRDIDRLRDHYVVCGLGRMGLTICEYLHDRRKPFVVIESNEAIVAQHCAERHWMAIAGDATDDDVLVKAGIGRARSLASVLSTDADNVYVVLSARMLSPSLQIVARASDQKAIEKMERAGATRIVSPFSTGAVKMARFMLNPSIEDFLEVADSRGNDLELAEIQVTGESPFIGKQLMQTDLRSRGIMVIGIRRADGERLMPPDGSAVIQAGDSLFAFGTSDAVNEIIGDDMSARLNR